MRKFSMILTVLVLIVAIAGPALAGGRRGHDRGRDYDYREHRDNRHYRGEKFDWRIFLPPPPVIIVKPFPEPDPWPEPWPPSPPPYYDPQGRWEERWVLDHYAQRWYLRWVWVPIDYRNPFRPLP